MKTPSGVKKYGHETAGASGKFHPSTLGSGPNTVAKEGGGERKNLGAVGTSGSERQPRGVMRGDGTERLRGTEVNHKNASRSLPKTGTDTSFKPSGVKTYSGTKTPKSVK